MPVGKSSIDRIAKATKKPTEGIRSLAPEVPAGDPAKPATPKKTAKKPTAQAKKPTAQAKKPASTAEKAAAAARIPTIASGEELPFWLL